MQVISSEPPYTSNWQEQLRGVITTPRELLELLGLDEADVDWSGDAGADFALKVPVAFARRMRRGDPRDPLLLQVLARGAELLEIPGYHRDPVDEQGAALPHRGILHKYRGRVLLIVISSQC